MIVTANQHNLYGAVAEICEEYESLHERTERPVVMGQSSTSLVLRAYKIFLLQQYGERIEKPSQQDKLSKFCLDEGFLSVVENGQYFMTKDTGDLTQRDEKASQPKGCIQRNIKIGPVLEIATCCLHGKYGVEIRIGSLSRDNTHSWVRIFNGSLKFVMNLNNIEQEMPIEGKSKTTKKGTCWLFTENHFR